MIYKFLTDISTKINNQEIETITSNKSIIGQIMYVIDKLSNENKDIVYLTNSEMYDSISSISKKINNFHNNEIIVVNTNTINDLKDVLNIKEKKLLVEYLQKNKSQFERFNNSIM